MVKVELVLSDDAAETLEKLKRNKSQHRILKDVVKTFRLMEQNIRHPSLNSHEFKSLKGPNGEKIFEVYAQQKTPGAYRILWYYGPGKDIVSIVAIIPHP
jgi:hypothetical protein